MRVVLCDDNPVEKSFYSNMIREISKEEGIDIDLLEFETAKQMLFELEDEIDINDIFLLDINMPEVSGMQAAIKLRESGYRGEIVFLTVSKNYMLSAFDVHAFNYIVKGETKEEKAKQILREVILLAEDKAKEYMLFTGVGEYRNIAISSIKYFEVNGKIITVHYGNNSFEFVSTIGKLENILFNRGFIRVHRSYMVSKSAIKSFSYGEIILIDELKLPVGRKYYAQLKETMSKKVVS